MSNFVVTLPIRTSIADEKQLETCFAAAKQIYNASLGESLRLLDLMRESKAWQTAKKLPRTLKKGKKSVPNPARSKAFKAVIKRFDFKESAIHRFAIRCKNECWIGDHLGSHDTQKLATRAFRAVQSYSFGNRGRPRFKGKRGLRSVEAKSNSACIRWRNGIVYWGKLILPALLPPNGKDIWLEQALQAETSYCRILHRTIKGRQRWFVQLVQKGAPPWKKTNAIGSGVTVGLDIGPSTIAIVSDEQVSLRQFCSEVQQPWSKIKQLQRKMDRSKRATNGGNYETDRFVKKDKHWKRKRGNNKKGIRTWQFSQQYQRIRAHKAELERRLSETRKVSHGRLANVIVAQGNVIKTEQLSYKSFQKHFGRSVTVRAPGMFVIQLKRKAENAGGKLVEFSTHKTKLSQYCHGCGTYTKKPLSQRIHSCECGIEPIQRDLYSAFLAKYVESNKLDVCHVNQAWTAAEPLLVQATSRGF